MNTPFLFRNVPDTPHAKILEIGNYPPPLCGWAIQLKLLVEEIRRRRHECVVLKINENRRHRSAEYVDVQGPFDFAWKVLKFVLLGYSVHVHLNAESPKGYLLACWPLLCCRMLGRESAMTFHGGIPQKFFPAQAHVLRQAYRAIFLLSGKILCNSKEIKNAIEAYGIKERKITAIPGFSPEYLQFETASLSPDLERFLSRCQPVFFSYVSFRPEYRLEVLRQAMSLVTQQIRGAGFIWLGFPEKEIPQAKEYVSRWGEEERASLLLLGNLSHEEFLTLLQRCTAMIRTPACDGVSASVLESIALRVPVVASENGRRPQGTITYDEFSAVDLADKIRFLILNYESVKQNLGSVPTVSNLCRTADWLLQEESGRAQVKSVSSV